MRQRLYLPLVFLIISLLAIISINLHVTGSAFEEMRKVTLSQRTYYKGQAMQRMANYFYVDSDSLLGVQLASTNNDLNASNFLALYKPEEGFPLVWSQTTSEFAKFGSFKTLNSLVTYLDSTHYKDIDKIKKFEEAILGYYQSGREVIEIEGPDKEQYLLTWVIVPRPSPDAARYIYCSLTPSKIIVADLHDMELQYRTLFIATLGLLASLFLLIPLTFRRIDLWIFGKQHK